MNAWADVPALTAYRRLMFTKVYIVFRPEPNGSSMAESVEVLRLIRKGLDTTALFAPI